MTCELSLREAKAFISFVEEWIGFKNPSLAKNPPG
jgi:hypothetical protein